MRVNERVKEAPAHALRAVFGGIGSLLSVSDKIRNKPATAEAPATAPAAAHETAAPATAAAPAEATAPETTAVPDVAPAAAAPEEVVAPETTAVPDVVAAPETTAVPDVAAASEDAAPKEAAAPEVAAELPLANYDSLTIASLRARLRNLSADQLAQLIDYEKAHANRAEVITMFERRITKLNLGLTQALPKLAE
jgi:hypothetical protein